MIPTEKASGNFQTLWIKHDTNCSEKHQLFFKAHSVRNQDPQHPKGKTLFILNVPPLVTADSLKKGFTRHCGPVKSVDLQQNSPQNGFRIGYVVFTKESSLDKALSLSGDFTLLAQPEQSSESLIGVQKWIHEYNQEAMIDEQETKAEIEKYMAEYDQKVEARLAAEDNQEDADGWVTVSSKKKRGQFAPSRKESTIDKVQQKEQEKTKKKQLLNFYTFQIRESKKQHLADLRKKFEMDKKKLQQLKAKRTFKPFG